MQMSTASSRQSVTVNEATVKAMNLEAAVLIQGYLSLGKHLETVKEV